MSGTVTLAALIAPFAGSPPTSPRMRTDALPPVTTYEHSLRASSRRGERPPQPHSRSQSMIRSNASAVAPVFF